MKRGFETVNEKFRKNDINDISLPMRASKGSAGYDFITPKYIYIPTNNTSDLIFTDIKAFMRKNEVLMLYIRSSLGIKSGILLANSTGIIDSDYYNNSENDGNIGFKLLNTTNKPIFIKKGERIIQGVFMSYFSADNEENLSDRSGGFGSTGK